MLICSNGSRTGASLPRQASPARADHAICSVFTAQHMQRVGLALAVHNATPEVRRAAHYTTKADGGKGAARELVELILKSKGIWDEMIDEARA